MKFALISRRDDLSMETTRNFYKLAEKYGLIEDNENPDIILSVGGDGTLLEAFHDNLHRLDKVSFLGIHTGHLGFYADWHPDELEKLASLMADKPLTTIEYPLLQVEISAGKDEISYLALNEFTIKNFGKTLVMKIKINQEEFEMFRGDGLCVSTPSGSTGYNKSLGGALIHPTLESIQVSEMASINNRVYRTIGSPLLLPRHHYLELYPQYVGELSLTIDHINKQMEEIYKVCCFVADEKIRFARYRPFPFWNRVRDAFIGSQHLE